MPDELADAHRTLSPAEARWHCDPARFDFETTDELESPEPFLGQKRALRALQFGAETRNPGFNVFVVGRHGTGRTSMAVQYLRKLASRRPIPDDLCYVNRFDDDDRPRALRLPAGQGRALRDGMNELVKELSEALPQAFEEEDYDRDRMALRMQIEQRQAEVFEELRKAAEEQGYAIARTQQGFAVAPVRDGAVLEPAQLAELSEEEQTQLKAGEKEVRDLLRQTLRRFRDIEKESHADLEHLERGSAEAVVAHLMTALREQMDELPVVHAYLDDVERDVLDHLEFFQGGDDEDAGPMPPGGPDAAFPFTDRYRVNLLVDNSKLEGAPVVREDYPTYRNLLGRVDHQTTYGQLLTHFTMLRAGSMHRANGGYLVVDAEDLLASPQAWEGFKRAMRVKELKFEEPFDQLKVQSTVSLTPDAVELDVKVVLIGTPRVHHLLHNHDPDAPELFKVNAEFRNSMGLSDSSLDAFAGFCAARCQDAELLPLSPRGVALLAEQSARNAGQQDRLDLRFRDLIDLIHESDYWAREIARGGELPEPRAIEPEHIEMALRRRYDRSKNLQEDVVRMIREGTIRIDLDGELIGQINGLTVLQSGQRPFGAPARLSARITAGQGYVVNVEREVQLSGPFHNKGVLILTGYLKGRYGLQHPLSVNASVVFEQSYSPVDGDSATLAEICAILSGIAEVPLRQDVAVTGSVDQMGRVQAVGGVNEKIEGFWRALQAVEHDGGAGVILPASNVRHLMLDREVVHAIGQGALRIWPVETVDDAIEILTGQPSAEVDTRVEQRLETLRENLRGAAAGGPAESMVLVPGAQAPPNGPPDPGPKR